MSIHQKQSSPLSSIRIYITPIPRIREGALAQESQLHVYVFAVGAPVCFRSHATLFPSLNSLRLGNFKLSHSGPLILGTTKEIRGSIMEHTNDIKDRLSATKSLSSQAGHLAFLTKG